MYRLFEQILNMHAFAFEQRLRSRRKPTPRGDLRQVHPQEYANLIQQENRALRLRN